MYLKMTVELQILSANWEGDQNNKLCGVQLGHHLYKIGKEGLFLLNGQMATNKLAKDFIEFSQQQMSEV